MRKLPALALVFALILTGGIGYYAGTRDLLAPAPAAGGAACATFPETGKTVCDPFLAYWHSHGGLAQQGFPISDEFQEVSPVDGKTYTVQYFERAVFEKHPENAPPYDVLLSLLGREKYLAKYGGPQPSPQPGGYPRTATTNQVQLTVYEVRGTVQPTYTQPAAGNRFVGIDVGLRNVGGKTFSTNKLYFHMRGGDGRDYQIDYVGVPEPQVSLRDLLPGDDTRGWITFEVPIGMQLVRLTFDHAVLDAPVTVPLN